MGARLARSTPFLGLLLGLGLVACGGEVPFDVTEDATPIDAPRPAPVVPVMRVHSWPGSGLQVVVEVPPELLLAPPPAAWIETMDGQHIDAAIAPGRVSSGVTAVVVLPSADPATHAKRIAAADALLRNLPAGERVALFVARDHAELLADVQIRREHARERLAALTPEPAATALIATREVRDLLEALQSSHGLVGRTAIVVGDTAVEDPPEARRVVQVLSMPVDGDLDVVSRQVGAQVVARRGAIYRIGACPSFAADTPFKLHLGDGHADDLYAPEPMAHLAGLPCVAEDAAADRYPFPSEIDLVFTPEERPIFEQAFNSANELALWRTSIRLGTGEPVPAEGHLRGQGTLSCARKSFTIQLDGERRRLMPDVAADNFLLISMCQDESYFGQVFVDRLLQEQDLFTPGMRYVKVRVDGVNRGVYLMTEQPDNTLRDNSLAIQSVIRRRYDIDGQPAEVKYPNDPVEAAAEATRFEALGDLARTGPLQNLDAELHARIDMDAYTRLLAMYSLVQNGDYIDEFYFWGSKERGNQLYRAMGWDTDDAFSPCHGGGGRGIVDRCMLTYCAEAELDYSLLRSPPTYNRFLRSLDGVLGDVTPEKMAATMAKVREDLWVVLDDDETARALVEIGGPTMMSARTTIENRMNTILGQLTATHASLLTRRAACPLTP